MQVSPKLLHAGFKQPRRLQSGAEAGSVEETSVSSCSSSSSTCVWSVQTATASVTATEEEQSVSEHQITRTDTSADSCTQPQQLGVVHSPSSSPGDNQENQAPLIGPLPPPGHPFWQRMQATKENVDPDNAEEEEEEGEKGGPRRRGEEEESQGHRSNFIGPIPEGLQEASTTVSTNGDAAGEQSNEVNFLCLFNELLDWSTLFFVRALDTRSFVVFSFMQPHW